MNIRVKTLATFSKLGRNSWVDPLVGIRIFEYFIFVRVVSFDPNPGHLTTKMFVVVDLLSIPAYSRFGLDRN